MKTATSNIRVFSSLGPLVICLAALTAGPLPSAAQQQKTAAKPAATTSAPQIKTPQPNAEDPATTTTIVGSGTVSIIPVFTTFRTVHNSGITQTGSGITVTGSVTAASFAGDGSALTNVNAATVGGFGPSSFAQTGVANVFSTNQTINGNLNLTGSLNNALTVQGNLTDSDGQLGANMIGGFGGATTSNGQVFPGNSIDPSSIGATIAGGGGAYDSSTFPPPPSNPTQTTSSQHMQLPHALDERLQSRAAQPEARQALPPGFPPAPGNNTVNPGSSWGSILGGLSNNAGAWGATVGGGVFNFATGNASTVAGGWTNKASNDETTVSGGYKNTASGPQATVAGGSYNTASGAGSTVSGGNANNATGDYSFAAGGLFNLAKGLNSFAAGCEASATSPGSFVWAGGVYGEAQCNPLSDQGVNSFVAEADGGFFFYTQGGSITGATLPAGSGSWSSLSDRNAKEMFTSIDAPALLEKLAALPVSTWKYKAQSESIRHLGPTAQDFHDAFGLGEDDKHISTVDAEGVALAGIKALYEEMKSSLAEKDRQIEELRDRIAQLEHSAK